ncbi:MAG: hypothetical protein NVS3B2_10940 [Ramlibacter sp.]
MSEALGQGPAQGVDPAAGPSAGTLLREAREAAGWHSATLAAALKVPVRKLDALEADRFDLLPDAVFVRALAASICRTLKLDPAPILQRLPANGPSRLAASEAGINAPFRSPRDGARPTWVDQMSRPVVLAVAALLLGALALLVLPSRHEQADWQAQPPPVAGVPAPEMVSEPAQAVLLTAAPASAPAATGVPATIAPPAAVSKPAAARAAAAASAGTTVARASVAAAAVSSASGAASASVAAPVTPASPVEGVVVFKAKAPSWVQVTDAQGKVALRKLLAGGESAGATGALPLAVTVGSVSATQVEVRGKPFDLAPLSRDNVARFEVK